MIEAACRKLQSEMLQWSANRGQPDSRFDGAIPSLSRRYQTDEASPFKPLEHDTQHKDTYTLAQIEKAFSTRSLAALQTSDFHRWYDAAKKPKVTGCTERVRRAYGERPRWLYLLGTAVRGSPMEGIRSSADSGA
ncbi:hypothetical protein ACLBYG_25335 [Methylobacterium sp. D53M]